MIDKEAIWKKWASNIHLNWYERAMGAMEEFAVAVAEEAFNDGAWRDPGFIFPDTFDEFLKEQNLKRPT